MRVQVETGEIEKEQARLEFGKLSVKNLAVFGQHGARLLQIFLVVKNPGGARFGVFGNALRVELAYFLDEVARIALGGGNRQRGIGGIKINGRDVQLKSRMRLLEIETADSLYVSNERNQLKLNVDPVAPFSFAQHKLLILEGKFSDWLQRVDGNREGLESGWRALAKRIGGPNKLRGHLRISHRDRNDLSAFHHSGGCHGVIGVKGKCTVASAQVGRAHAGQGSALRRHRRKIRRHAHSLLTHPSAVHPSSRSRSTPAA